MKILGWLGFILIVGFSVKFTLFSPNFNFDFSNPCFFCEVKTTETSKPQKSDYEQKRLTEMEKGRDQIRDHGRLEKKVETEINKGKVEKDLYREKGCVIIQNGQPISEQCN